MPHYYRPLSVILTSLVFAACGGGSSTDGSSSSSGSSASSGSSSSSSSGSAMTSHNAGESCLTSNCHGPGGAGTTYTVAGTMYTSGNASTPQTNGIVRLYLHNTNTLQVTLNTDDSGNFYTAQAIPAFENDPSAGGIVGADAEIEGPTGATRTMPGVITNGGCNGCHGNGNGVLNIN